MEKDDANAAIFFQDAIQKLCELQKHTHTKVLDFGCGSGRLVQCLLSLGYDAYGCDIQAYWRNITHENAERLSTIVLKPYRLPFNDNTFDVVVSTSVLEHAQNKEELFTEIYRILKVGGYSMHIFPGKWYLPVEPHIHVPLVNFFWPHCPRWWFGLWALLGVRNEFQDGKPLKEIIEDNSHYCKHGLSYWTNRRYKKLSLKIFGNYSAPMDFYIRNSYGGVANLFRRFPFQRLIGRVVGEVRMNFIVSRKPGDTA